MSKKPQFQSVGDVTVIRIDKDEADRLENTKSLKENIQSRKYNMR